MHFEILPINDEVAFTFTQLYIYSFIFMWYPLYGSSDSSERSIMSKLIPGNQKHLTLNDRLRIEDLLNCEASFKDIARFLCKDPTTISKEVKKYRLSDYRPTKGYFSNERNHCVHRFNCSRVNVCNKIILCGVKCSSCPTCNSTCKDFKIERCTRLDKAPYVCNGCQKPRHKCTIFHKYHYDARYADRKYHETLVNSRSGIPLTRHELLEIDKTVAPLVSQGQSPYQIICNHPELDLSVRTLYTYIDKGVLCTRNIDLKRKVKFKPRKCHKTQIHTREVFENRLYSDFVSLGLDSWVEMDTVHSCRGCNRVLLTFFFTKEKLFLAYILDRCTPGAVRRVFDRLERRLGIFGFLTLFENILTDRGVEFGLPDELETGVDGVTRSSIYFCDPMRSGQKGGIEQAHTTLRNILPKGTDFSFLTQWDVNLIVNHINSMPRESLSGNTPYNAALKAYGEDALKALQLKPIDPDKVNLTPELIRFTK